MNEKIELGYVGDKFGIKFKDFATNNIDDITKGVKKILGEDSKVYEFRSSTGTSGNDIEYNSFKDGYFTPISEQELGKKGVFEENLDDIYDSICKNIDIKLDKDNFSIYELDILDLPPNSSEEVFWDKFNKFAETLSDEDKNYIEELSDYAYETFKRTQNLKENYNVVIIDKDKELEIDDTRKLTKKEEVEVLCFKNNFLSNFVNNLENIDATIDLSNYLESKNYSEFVDGELNDYFAFFPETKNLREIFKEKALNEVKEDIKNIIEVREDMPVSYYSKEFISGDNVNELRKSYIDQAKEIEKDLPVKEKSIKKEVVEEKEVEKSNDREIEL